MHGLLRDARRLAHVAYFRRDPLPPELLNVKPVPGASVLSRFFAGFGPAGHNLACSRPRWRFGLERIPSRKYGYTIDLDPTRLLHEDGNRDGVRAGYARHGIKPCLHPLLAVIAEARLVTALAALGQRDRGSNAAA